MKTKNIHRLSKGISLLIILSALAAVAATTVLYQTTATSSFKLTEDAEGGRSVTKTVQNYEIFRSFDDSKGENLYLINSKIKTIQNLMHDGVQGQVSWSVRKGDALETALWNRTEVATELNLHFQLPVLVSGLGGCCAEMTGYRMFDIETGRLLMSFNDFNYRAKVVQPFSLEIPNSQLPVRYIGLISQDSTRDRDFISPAPGKQAVLIVKYAVDKLKQKIQIDMPVADGYAASVLEVKLEADPAVPGSNTIEFRDDSATLWNIDGSENPNQISGVILKIVIDAGLGQKTIKIPVKNDQLDLNSAQLPGGISVQPIVTFEIL